MTREEALAELGPMINMRSKLEDHPDLVDIYLQEAEWQLNRAVAPDREMWRRLDAIREVLLWETCTGCGKDYRHPHLCRKHMLCGICHPPVSHLSATVVLRMRELSTEQGELMSGEFTTDLGCRVMVVPPEARIRAGYPERSALVLRMADPTDPRWAEVLLTDAEVVALAKLLTSEEEPEVSDDLGDALTGPPPTWRPGYDDDTPEYLATVRAMGIPGQDGPTGGDVVQGEIHEAEPAMEETPGHYEPHSEYGTGQEDIPPCVAGDCGCTGTGLIGCPGRDGDDDD